MKKVFSIFAVIIFTITYAYAQTDWVAHKGDKRVSLKFPAKPKEVIPGTFVAMDNDSVAYIFTIVDFVKVGGVDSVALAPVKATPAFAAQLKTGMNQSLPNVNFSDFKIDTWNGFTSYTSVGTDPKKKRY